LVQSDFAPAKSSRFATVNKFAIPHVDNEIACAIIVLMESRIRKAVSKTVRTADLSTVSAKQIRKSVESKLGLEVGELSSEQWKGVVNEAIQETMAAIERGEPSEEETVNEARMSLLDVF
jgi:hypothetical protein